MRSRDLSTWLYKNCFPWQLIQSFSYSGDLKLPLTCKEKFENLYLFPCHCRHFDSVNGKSF